MSADEIKTCNDLYVLKSLLDRPSRPTTWELQDAISGTVCFSTYPKQDCYQNASTIEKGTTILLPNFADLENMFYIW
jgi:hypothetical protein